MAPPTKNSGYGPDDRWCSSETSQGVCVPGGKMTEAADSKADVDRRIGLATGVAGNLAVI